MTHEQHMKRALLLARRGLGRTSPNPMVGAVVVKDGVRVGEGYHLYERKDHAEVVALERAGEDARGADLYTTLEPCSHHGRTAPCAERIIERGIGRVFVGTLDPNPLVGGRGVTILEEAGVDVEVGLCEAQAKVLNEAFFHYITEARPFVTLKLAMTLDGKIATKTGVSKWITSERSRRTVQRLRFGSDGILVGINTVLNDNPSLDVRWRSGNRITKVILDSRLRTPTEARLFGSKDEVIIFHGQDADQGAKTALGRQARLVEVPPSGKGLALDRVLKKLGELRMNSLLVEGGSQVAASFLSEGFANRIRFFYGPKLIGGTGLSSVGELGVEDLVQALSVRDLTVRRLDSDFLVEGLLGGAGTIDP